MIKTINRKILICFSMLLFSCFFVGNPVSAADNHSIEVHSNVYNASTPINVEFKYEIVADSDNHSGATNEPTELIIKFDNVTPTSGLTSVSGAIDFLATNYTSQGIYRYFVKEVSSSNSDYEVSNEEYEIYVIASESNKNVYHLAKNVADGTKGEINFNHNPEYSFATISATTIGDAVDRNEYFRYKIEIDSLCVGCSYDVLGQDEYVRYNNQVLRTTNRYVAGTDSYVYIYLKNGQTVNIGLTEDGKKQIPIGTKVKISIDENINERKWAMYIDDMEVDSKEFIMGANIVIRLLAERNMLVPNTGLFGELWPFTALVMMGVVGFLIFIFARKSNDSEQE